MCAHVWKRFRKVKQANQREEQTNLSWILLWLRDLRCCHCTAGWWWQYTQCHAAGWIACDTWCRQRAPLSPHLDLYVMKPKKQQQMLALGEKKPEEMGGAIVSTTLLERWSRSYLWTDPRPLCSPSHRGPASTADARYLLPPFPLSAAARPQGALAGKQLEPMTIFSKNQPLKVQSVHKHFKQAWLTVRFMFRPLSGGLP